MPRWLLVCLAGAVGTGLRYAVTMATQRYSDAFPVGTLSVNLAGSFLIAFFGMMAVHSHILPEPLKPAITIGLLGGLTTYSSFNNDTLRLFEGKAFGTAGLYLAATLFGCLACGIAGSWVGRRYFVPG